MNINVSKRRFKKAGQKGGASLSNRLHLLPADTVEHALRRALLQYAQVAELATHTRYLHVLQHIGYQVLQFLMALALVHLSVFSDFDFLLGELRRGLDGAVFAVIQMQEI